jgi:uncharacterized cofD-like protein
MQKIVTIGGGTGQYQILRGLKNYECDITAVVTMADDGGSSGKLRDEYGVLPPGDFRQCLVALAEGERGEILRDLFNYRYGEDNNVGNLIIATLTNLYGSSEGLKSANTLFSLDNSNVLPVTTDDVTLCANTKKGKYLKGETNLDLSLDEDDAIEEVFYESVPFLYKETGKAIRAADKIVICSGDLYRSIVPTLLVKGMSDAIKESSAMKIYICNLFTKKGTFGFRASDFVREIEKYSGITFDKIIINTKVPSEEIRKKYLLENSAFVENDMQDDKRVVVGNYVKEYPSERKTLFRHVPEKIAKEIIAL